MGKLTSTQRKNIPSSEFALPKERKYPLNDHAHQVNALARVSQMVTAGKVSPASAAKVRAKAHAKLGK